MNEWEPGAGKHTSLLVLRVIRAENDMTVLTKPVMSQIPTHHRILWE